ncbi:heme-degrading domain-containing protein [Trinickia acidisoli]|uniref:heme-degrading domain-containing protein n=1 Tax=Trinickia acidisoli TaxID=2767482 RepID=UPI001A8E3FD4|nr:heme-degrading domain-containing protein [Trinickia acidisoli]
MNLDHDLQAIAKQERVLVFPRFDATRAWALGAFLRELAIARNHVLAIDVRTFGLPLFFSVLDGTAPDNAAWVRRKSNVVAHFRRSSYAIALRLQQSGATLADKYGLPAAEYAAAGGSFPITLAGVGAIGAVTVSGLSQRADHELVVEALCAELDHDFAELALDEV